MAVWVQVSRDPDEFELIGGIDDLGAADLGPIAPDAHDPDADSGGPGNNPGERWDTGIGPERRPCRGEIM